MKLPLYIVDVFAESKYEGNQLAVFIDETGVSSEMMLKLAREMHFSETTFITKSDLSNKKFKVRIFTPESELPFAGHPTLGTAYIAQKVLLKKQVNELLLDMKAGLIPVRFNYVDGEPDVLWMKQLNPVFGKTHDIEVFTEFLGLNSEDFDEKYPIQEVSTGVPFFIIPLKTKEAVQRLQVDSHKLAKYTKNTDAKWPLVFCSEPEREENHLKVRMVTSFTEDPATGSANGCLAGYLVKHRYFGESKVDVRVEQGAEIMRPSLLYLRAKEHADGIDVRVGGKVAFIAEGRLV